MDNNHTVEGIGDNDGEGSSLQCTNFSKKAENVLRDFFRLDIRQVKRSCGSHREINDLKRTMQHRVNVAWPEIFNHASLLDLCWIKRYVGHAFTYLTTHPSFPLIFRQSK